MNTRQHVRASYLLVGLVISALSNPSVAWGEPNTGEPACWTADALRMKAAEKRVRSGLSRARITRPAYPTHILPAVSDSLQGSIRRVDLPAGRKLVALTFDLCESSWEIAGYDGEIVDYLREHKIRATFFAGGHWLMTHPERAQQLLADPLFEIGNHSWSHKNLAALKGKDLLDQILLPQGAYEAVKKGLESKSCLKEHGKILSHKLKQMKLFRFPYGHCNPKSLKAVAKEGLLAIQWDISTADPVRGQSARQIAKTVLKRVKPGSIILAHANGRGWHTAKALPLFVPKLREEGYNFVTVSELIAAGKPHIEQQCYDQRPGDTKSYTNRTRRKQKNKAKGSLDNAFSFFSKD